MGFGQLDEEFGKPDGALFRRIDETLRIQSQVTTNSE
jgi:hypothetical protein